MGRFAIESESRGGFAILQLIDTASGAFACVLPEVGATLWSLALGVTDRRGSGSPAPVDDAEEILAADPLDQIQRNSWYRGRILFPFNDRIPGGRYRFGDTTHQLPTNDPETGDAIHGLVYDQPFEIGASQVSPDFARVTLRCAFNERRWPGYPFSAEIEVRYTLSDSRLDVSMTARNSGVRYCPVAMGMHPYIRTEPSIDGAALRCPSDTWVEVDTHLLPTGALPATEGTTYDLNPWTILSGRELDIAMYRGGTGRAITEIRRLSDTIVLEQETAGFAYTQLFIPPDRSSIAVEPISAATNSFNAPSLGLRVLSPGEEFEGCYAVSRQSNEFRTP